MTGNTNYELRWVTFLKLNCQAFQHIYRTSEVAEFRDFLPPDPSCTSAVGMGSMVSGPTGSAAAQPRDEMCAICRQPRARSGDHRGVTLPCGHGFGHVCIARRLRAGPARCPQCGARGSVAQLRAAPGRGAASSAGDDEAREPDQARREREELRRERAERRRLEKDLVETRQRLQKKDNVVRMLQGELRKLQRKVRLEESDYDCDSNVSWTPRANERGDLTE